MVLSRCCSHWLTGFRVQSLRCSADLEGAQNGVGAVQNAHFSEVGSLPCSNALLQGLLYLQAGRWCTLCAGCDESPPPSRALHGAVAKCRHAVVVQLRLEVRTFTQHSMPPTEHLCRHKWQLAVQLGSCGFAAACCAVLVVHVCPCSVIGARSHLPVKGCLLLPSPLQCPPPHLRVELLWVHVHIHLCVGQGAPGGPACGDVQCCRSPRVTSAGCAAR